MSSPTAEADTIKKMKKEAKAKEKELKKQKALQKAIKLQEQQACASTLKTIKTKNARLLDDEDDNARDPETPFGQKKRMASQMAKMYHPRAVEKSWYEWWEKMGFFSADANSSKPPFVIVLPPPNVTGTLHIGHALTAAIEDTIIRWRRMSGYNAMWVPGMDHAGIATQVVVEKKLMSEKNLTRHDIGREQFVAKVWDWKKKHGSTILQQLRRLGASLDWSRGCFTMDEKRSNAVTEAFVRLHKQGLLYRANRIVNWDCVLRTAISDIEVDYIDIEERTLLRVPGYDSPVEFGVLTSFAYPLEEGLGEIVVATTRVETMLGDTAIAVHPNDKRYEHLHGKHAIHPFNGRRICIVLDEIVVDPEFGTGAVKITPAHDPNDFNAGKRHNLDFINIFTDDGKINEEGGEFAGMPRFEAREAVTEALKKKGLFKEAKNNEMRLGICSRSQDVVEPMIKPQWYLKCSGMGKQALDAVVDDEHRKLEIIPREYTAEWKRWLENIRDWCISRQLWWGHRIPAWYVVYEGDKQEDFGFIDDRWVIARNEEEAQAKASDAYQGNFQLIQDPDVLDTWFSSGLFPLSVLGWPDNTEDLKAFYPTAVLETGHDILFFWVARMVMLGMTLGGNIPFTKVYLHPMIRDAHGRKMSKSLGNVIDPLDVINGIDLEGLRKKLLEGNLDAKEVAVSEEGLKKDFPAGIWECGADALRFALVSYTAQCWTNERVESEMNLVETVVKSLRSLAKESRERRPAHVMCRNNLDWNIICSHRLEIEALAHLSSLTILSENDSFPTSTVSSGYEMCLVNEYLSVFLRVPRVKADPEKIREKMEKFILEREKLYLMINSPGYQEKTSEKIQESNADKLECLKQEISTLGRLWWMNSPGYRKKASEEDQACSADNLEFLEKEIMERLRCSFV
nr:valine--tRNA ligase, mitochondrial 1-like isoform X2 [Malus domestica]